MSEINGDILVAIEALERAINEIKKSWEDGEVRLLWKQIDKLEKTNSGIINASTQFQKVLEKFKTIALPTKNDNEHEK